MIEAKLRVGTKIKMLTDDPGYWDKGAIGYLVNTSIFQKGELRDCDGSLWAKINASRYERCCLNDWQFKILEY